MSVFVLVHGGWGGGWQWRRVANLLRDKGHEVYTPTLSGVGDRSGHEDDPARLNLSRHIEDLVQVLEFEDLHEVVFVGWSSGMPPVEGATDRVPERVRRVVNLDGEVVEDGRSSDDQMSPEEATEFAAMLADSTTPGWLAPPSYDDLLPALVDPELTRFVADRERPHPLAVFAEPFPDTGRRRREVPHSYIGLTPPGEDEYPGFAALRADDYWDFSVLPLNHLALLYAPEAIADALQALA